MMGQRLEKAGSAGGEWAVERGLSAPMPPRLLTLPTVLTIGYSPTVRHTSPYYSPYYPPPQSRCGSPHYYAALQESTIYSSVTTDQNSYKTEEYKLSSLVN
jgi:hypothetical protein